MARAKRYTGREALGIDPTTISDSGLRGAVRALADIANKRIKRFQQAAMEYSPAYRRVMEALSGQGRKKFVTKGLSREELEKEYMRAKQFVTSETGTVKETKEYYEKLRQEAQRAGIEFDEVTFSGVTELYHRLLEMDPSIGAYPPSEVKREITRMQADGYDDISILLALKKKYGQMQEERTDEEIKNAVSDFFTPNNV